ncbi:hypothetical protein [Chitinophaga flava]|uniref:hypothetical protein n=1 Tax=Chitinophaga flava TaxID=2259036 RepID=UPI0011BF94A0|nr:hypothetical protein [Chitinophaga flava]
MKKKPTKKLFLGKVKVVDLSKLMGTGDLTLYTVGTVDTCGNFSCDEMGCASVGNVTQCAFCTGIACLP